MKKIIVILFLLSCNSVISQNFNITPKYSIITNNKYSSKEASIELSYDVTKLNISLGFSFGISDMHYDEYNWQSVNEDYKTFYGVQINYYPFNIIKEKYKPFIGLKTLFASENWLTFSTGGNHVFFPGYYFPSTEDDMIISPLVGSVFYLKSVNLILEFEYRMRSFVLTFDEYNNNYVKQSHSIKKSINSLTITFGIQILL